MNRIQDWLQQLLDYSAFEIGIVRWSAVLLIILLTVVVIQTIKKVLISVMKRWSKNERFRWIKYVKGLVKKTTIFLSVAIGLFWGITLLDVDERFLTGAYTFIRVMVILQMGVWASALTGVVADGYKLVIEDDNAQITALSAITFVVRVVIWAVVLMMILDNLGFDITAMVASLGIGGIAVALAAQNILGDLFAFFSIIIDQPFVKGDFIIVGSDLGSIEHIGIKSTRVRSLGGEQLIFANKDLLNSRIRNFKRMEQRRIVFEFGLVYDTSAEHVKLVPELVESYIKALDTTRFDRAHFKEFGDSSLNFEVVYWVLSAEFGVYMDTHQAIIFEMLKEFRERGIQFAYPTRTVHMVGQPKEGGAIQKAEPSRSAVDTL